MTDGRDGYELAPAWLSSKNLVSVSTLSFFLNQKLTFYIIYFLWVNIFFQLLNFSFFFRFKISLILIVNLIKVENRIVLYIFFPEMTIYQ